MIRRFNPDHKIPYCFEVSFVPESSAKVSELGGDILVPQMTVSTMAILQSAWTQRAMSLGRRKPIRVIRFDDVALLKNG